MKRDANLPNCDSCPTRPESPFGVLSPVDLEMMNQCKTSNKYKKNQIIFYEGNKPFGIHCIKSGRLKLYRVGNDGREQIVRLVQPGDIVGFKDLISTHDYSLSAEALEDSEVCFLDRNAFFTLMDKSSKLAFKFLEYSCEEQRKNEDTICSFAQNSVRERVANTLLILKERYGLKTDRGWKLDIRLKRDEIAGLAGTVLESAVRYLSEFKGDGIIALEGKEITILKLEKLIKITGNS